MLCAHSVALAQQVLLAVSISVSMCVSVSPKTAQKLKKATDQKLTLLGENMCRVNPRSGGCGGIYADP